MTGADAPRGGPPAPGSSVGDKAGPARVADRPGPARRLRRKEELADAAIRTLKQLGYARTSLRDIAERSDVAVGTLHYYFADKTELIGFCVRRYKARFVATMDATLAAEPGTERLAERFAQGLAQSIRKEAEAHRLWYDIRAQSMFDPAFREVVQEIETALIALLARFFARLEGAPAHPGTALDGYLLMDAAFCYHLQRFLAGDNTAPGVFADHALALLRPLLTREAGAEGPRS
ncbi:TetR/AcrR family transcriptional regulator [Pseudooceanicola aestuarii]|uniref:TetR/AcrR family transcriptional regulator n=1 Tax=Pseudooceanicola aestuarii TaxID=2697319 RepID=UPI0013D01C93|nr:TetR/AcrR family transcriptional regulator [Pseudooceanicola aestuarii]